MGWIFGHRSNDQLLKGLPGRIEYDGKTWRKTNVTGKYPELVIHFDVVNVPGEAVDNTILRLPYAEYKKFR